MKVQELVLNINNKEFKLDRGLEVKTYLPIEVKKTIAKGIMYDCTTEENGVIKIDSVQRYMSYVRYMITNHTNLEYTDEDYDALCSTKYGEATLLNAVISVFQSDANECNRILDMMMDDYFDNNIAENSAASVFNVLVNNFTRITTMLEDNIKNIDLKKMLPDGLDLNLLADFLNKTPK